MTNVFVRGVSVTARCLTTLLIAGGFLLNVSAKTDGQSTSAVASEIPYVSENILARSVLLDITYAGQRLVTVGQRGHIFYSDNQGESWRKAQVPVSATLTSVYFVDASNGWAAGHQGVILHTIDGGATWWQQIDGAGVNQLVLTHAQQRFDQLSLQASLNSLPQTKSPQTISPHISSELEELEQQLYDASSFVAEGATRPFLDILFINKEVGYAIGAFGMFVHTTDGGNTWQPWQDHLPNPDLFHLNAIVAKNDQLFIAAEAGNIYQLTNDNERWQSVELPYDGSIFGLNIDSNQHLIAFGLRGNVFVQQPNGRQWQRVDIDSDVSLFGGVVMQNKTLSLLSASGEVIVLDTDVSTTSNSMVPRHYQAGGKRGLSAGIQTPDGELLLVGGSGLLHFSFDNINR